MAAVEAANVGSAEYYIPFIAARVWQSFWELDGCRRGNGYAAFGINHQDIAAFQELAGFRFRAWERKALLAMDCVRVAKINDSVGKPKDEASAERPMSPELFDALFG